MYGKVITIPANTPGVESPLTQTSDIVTYDHRRALLPYLSAYRRVEADPLNLTALHHQGR